MPSPTPTARILLVDDHETNLATLEAILAPGGYELLCVTRGQEVCDAIVAFEPDLVLLDVMMPGMDGFEVCRAIRSNPAISAVPVVMLTALNDRSSKLAGIEAGADDFISKPLSVEELRVRVRTITRLNRYRVIAEQRTRLERLLELAPSAIVVVTGTAEVRSANRRTEEFFAGLGGHPMRGRSLLDGLPVEEAERLSALISATVEASPADAASGGIAEMQLRVAGGESERVLHVSATRLEERPAALALLSLNDITAEVRAREDTESINRRLDAMVRERTSRLEGANQLLSSYAVFVAHDLRSPLSAVKGYLSLLLSGAWPLEPKVRDCLEQMSGASKMIEEMITDTLELAADSKLRAEPARTVLDPRPVLERLCMRLVGLRPSPRPKIVIHPLPEVTGSPLLIERIFFNLVSNALKYSASRAEPFIEIGSIDMPAGPALYVRDNGVGFPQEEADTIFDEFARLSTSEGHEGLGIGLALVFRLVRAHHGRIWAEGRPGEGATFYVQLPAAGAEVSAAPPA